MQAKPPTISVIIAAYNRGAYIEQAVRSVQAQTYRHVEILIVNDGSTDDTGQIATQLATRDPCITVIHQANSGGPAQPRNLGIAQSTGEFICFLDPDDYWYPSKLEQQFKLMTSRPDVDMVFCDLDRVDQHGANLGPTYLERIHYLDSAIDHLEPIGPATYVTKPSFLAYSSVNVVGPTTCGVMLRRKRLQSLDEWFPLDLLVGEDIDLWFRILQHSRAAFINVPLYAYRQHPASLMHNDARVSIGLSATHARNYARVESLLSPEQKRKYRQRIAAHLFDQGYDQLMAGTPSEARRHFLHSFSWSPRAKAALAWCKSFLPHAPRRGSPS